MALGKTWTLPRNHPCGHTPRVNVARGGGDELVLGTGGDGCDPWDIYTGIYPTGVGSSWEGGGPLEPLVEGGCSKGSCRSVAMISKRIDYISASDDGHTRGGRVPRT